MNPRYKAYMIAHNIDDQKDVKNHEFSYWILKKWDEWSEITGRSRPFEPQDHADFNKWLMRTTTDGHQMELWEGETV